jgi:type I restriction enzyme S subunit
VRFEKLSDILNISMGKTPARKERKYWGKGHKWVSIRDLSQKVITETKEEITDLALKKSGIKLVSKGTLLFSFKLTIGKMAFAGTNLYTNEAIAAFVIKDPKKVDSNYLYYALKSVNLVGSNQAAMGKTLNSKSLAAIQIPLPDNINDQKRIAHLLGKVERVINQRKQNIQQFDDLLKSVFLDMFGDPVKNEKGWDVLPCDKIVINIQSGTSYGGEDKGFLEEDELGVLKISAVTKGYLDEREFKAVKKSAIKKKLRFIQKGDLLFSRANTVELVAASCVVYEDSETLFLPDKLWALTLADGIHIQYFNFLLKNERFRNKVKNLASGGHDSMLNISMKKFLTLDVPNPDEKLQNKFASIVEKVESTKYLYKQSLIDFENLYGALSQKAFKGKLELSKVPLPDESDKTSYYISTVDLENMTENNTENPIIGFSQFDAASLKDNDLRKLQMSKWFREWLEQCPSNSNLNINHYWQCIEFTTQDYLDDNDDPLKIGLIDYDHIKDEVFDAIRRGEIEQTTNMIKVEVNGKPTLEPGNQILLKKLN